MKIALRTFYAVPALALLGVALAHLAGFFDEIIPPGKVSGARRQTSGGAAWPTGHGSNPLLPDATLSRGLHPRTACKINAVPANLDNPELEPQHASETRDH